MGILSKGILGGYRGKVGPTVGARLGGQDIIRSMPSSYNDANTDLQKDVRSNFKKCVLYYQKHAAFIKATNIETIQKHSAYNHFVKKNTEVMALDEAQIAQQIEYSSGSLKTLSCNISPEADNTNINISWTDNSDDFTGYSDDFVNIMFETKTEEKVETFVKKARRSDTSVSVTLPDSFADKACYAYIAMSNTQKRKSSPVTRCEFTVGTEDNIQTL